ncbi:DRTGG domain-containing protein [Orenia metallireducens]|uniref:DRTGG domain-containing protein n=2 Tax=Orenia metallireducens TaxID=1413210 RepID=A0A285HDL0_9FIRM|nr:DRTGG domain-containing protein [Orenia metallireducens]PRX28954.1 DRTGG domain-containing protein [Orenia metallireducens]SNY32761.1 DRTGG domain-containing protein [Orenia metallireducens]
MKIKELVERLNLEVVVEGDLEVEVTGGYASDLLSNVMARSSAGNLWLTIQGHQNIVAIAQLIELAGILVTENFSIDDDTIKKAKELEINILRSKLDTYELSGKLYQLGIE